MKVQGRTVGVLVAAAAVLGSAGGAYALTRPSDEPVQVNFVEPAADATSSTTSTTAAMPSAQPTSTSTTTTTTPVATTSTTSAPVASKSSTTTKESTVAQPSTSSQPASTTSAPANGGPNLPPNATDPSHNETGTNIGVPTKTP